MSGSTFPITVTAQMRHGVLWEARALCGSSARLAKLLSLSPSMVGRWINFKEYPSQSWWDERGIEVEGKLGELLGRTVAYDDLFPKELRAEAFQRIKKQQEVTHDVPLDRLIEAGAFPALPPAPETVELREAIEAAMSDLSPRKVAILRMRFGLDGHGGATLEEVGEAFDVSRKRIMQLESRALGMLRHPSRSCLLKPFLNGAPVVHGTRTRAQDEQLKQI